MTDATTDFLLGYDTYKKRIAELESKLETERKAGNDAWHEQEDRLRELESRLGRIVALVNEQAEDEGLWFQAATAPEAYLQQELRKLHAAIEGGVVEKL